MITPSPAGAALTVLVPAAGSGTRFGDDAPKQYAMLDGRTLLACTLERLAQAFPDATLVVAVAPDDRAHACALAGLGQAVTVLPSGGATRAATVRRSLDALASRCGTHDWILVHDAARPCVPVDALHRLRDTLSDDAVGGLLAVPVADTLKRQAGDDAAPRVARTENRNGLWQAQTPQMFRFGVLRAALAAAPDTVTDEAQAVERLAATGACAAPRLVPGSALNLKVTYPADLALAQAIRTLQTRERHA